MRKTNFTKLDVKRTTIRNLGAAELINAAGGGILSDVCPTLNPTLCAGNGGSAKC